MQQTYKSIKSVKRGFTLVEMLIVLSIVGALTAASVSLYREVVENQRVTATIELLNIYAQIHYAPKKIRGEPNPTRMGVFYSLCADALYGYPSGPKCDDGYPYSHYYEKYPHKSYFKGGNKTTGYMVRVASLSKSACEKLATRVFNLYETILVNKITNSKRVENISDVPGLCVKIVGEAGKNTYEKFGNRIEFYAATE